MSISAYYLSNKSNWITFIQFIELCILINIFHFSFNFGYNEMDKITGTCFVPAISNDEHFAFIFSFLFFWSIWLSDGKCSMVFWYQEWNIRTEPFPATVHLCSQLVHFVVVHIEGNGILIDFAFIGFRSNWDASKYQF